MGQLPRLLFLRPLQLPDTWAHCPGGKQAAHPEAEPSVPWTGRLSCRHWKKGPEAFSQLLDTGMSGTPLWRKYLPTALAQSAECLDPFLSPFSFQPMMVGAVAG